MQVYYDKTRNQMLAQDPNNRIEETMSYLPQKHVFNNLPIAIASDSVQQRSRLHQLMERIGLKVVLSEPLTRLFIRKLEKAGAEVLLLDLHDDVEHDEELINDLLDKVGIPIIFNDVTAITVNEPAESAKWHHSLISKIAESAGLENWNVDHAEPDENSTPARSNITIESQSIARHVWVLGASLGGPEAVKRFLNALPADIPAAFVLAQHLGANFTDLLAEQLDRYTTLDVITPEEGHIFRHNEVLVAPVNQRIWINPIGNIELESIPEESPYTPSINRVVNDVAQRYGQRAGAIIFSGMGDDGVSGCREIQNLGGQVWVQTSDSCVISSMPDNVSRQIGADYTGSPEQLAHHLAAHLRIHRKEAS